MYDSYFQVDECIIAKFYLNYLAILSYTFYPEEKLTNWVTDLQCKQLSYWRMEELFSSRCVRYCTK